MAIWPTSSKKDELSSFIKSALGFKPKDISLYKTAFTHSSISKTKWENNERLEFLGDSVLDTIVAEMLFEKFPKKTEGELTQIKANLVSREHLNKVGKSLGLKGFIKKASNLNNNRYLEGNAFEALVGAVFLDLGYKKTKKTVFPILLKELDLNALEKIETDFKSKLYQWCQKHRTEVDTRFTSFETNNIKTYKATLFVEDRLIGEGLGASKKIAEKVAAENVFSSGSLDKVYVKKS